MRNNTEVALFLLVTYQDWCGERVATLDRANSIVTELMGMLHASKSKTALQVALKRADWSDSATMRKKLAEVLWPEREAIVKLYLLGAAKAVLGGSA